MGAIDYRSPSLVKRFDHCLLKWNRYKMNWWADYRSDDFVIVFQISWLRLTMEPMPFFVVEWEK